MANMEYFSIFLLMLVFQIMYFFADNLVFAIVTGMLAIFGNFACALFFLYIQHDFVGPEYLFVMLAFFDIIFLVKYAFKAFDPKQEPGRIWE